MNTPSVRSLLESLIPRESLLPADQSARWRTGPGKTGLPAAVVAPSSEEEMAGLLTRASREGWRVMPAGRGTWLEGGGPSEVTLVVSTQRMDGMREYEPADLTFTAGAGMALAALRNATEVHGQWLPLDPPGALDGSLGATVATGAWGSLRPLYGTPRDHVLGLTLVSGEGEILRWGGRVVKNVAGFDITRLCVGSWGTLGIVTGVSARLHPIPEVDTTLVFFGPEGEALLPSARAMALSPFPLAAVELLDPLPVEMGGAARGPKDQRRAALVLRIMGSLHQVGEISARVRGEIGREHGEPWTVAGPESRGLHGQLAGWEAGAALVARLSLLPSGMERLLREMRELGSSTAQGGSPTEIEASAHIGAGVLRMAIRRLPQEGPELEAWTTSLVGLRGRLEDEGGALTLSRGPAAIMREVGPWSPTGRERGLMAGLKAGFDPHGILAPGRLGLG